MEINVADIYEKVAFLDSEIKKIKRDATGFIKIHFLPHKRLLCPLDAVYEDLQENDQFTEEWLRVKSFLTECTADS